MNKQLILTGSINLCVSENQQQGQHMEYMHVEAGSPCLEDNHKLATSPNSVAYETGL